MGGRPCSGLSAWDPRSKFRDRILLISQVTSWLVNIFTIIGMKHDWLFRALVPEMMLLCLLYIQGSSLAWEDRAPEWVQAT